jgi:hypothetical protein
MNRLDISCSSKTLLLPTRSRVINQKSRMEPTGIMAACKSLFIDVSSLGF